jgi:hypothetical protein
MEEWGSGIRPRRRGIPTALSKCSDPTLRELEPDSRLAQAPRSAPACGQSVPSLFLSRVFVNSAALIVTNARAQRPGRATRAPVRRSALFGDLQPLSSRLVRQLTEQRTTSSGLDMDGFRHQRTTPVPDWRRALK